MKKRVFFGVGCADDVEAMDSEGVRVPAGESGL